MRKALVTVAVLIPVVISLFVLDIIEWQQSKYRDYQKYRGF